jgi:hypothetical protein
LREAASAKAGERVGVRGILPLKVEGWVGMDKKTNFPPPLNPLPPGEGRFFLRIFSNVRDKFKKD